MTTETEVTAPLVGIIMGSQSDWPTMRYAAETLAALQVPHETRIVSAHRTPDRLADYAKTARGRGLRVIIAGAGGAAHLPGMCAAWTMLPVLGVPVESHALKGMDSLLSIVQMPAGVPVGTLAIGRAGAINAALPPPPSWRCPMRPWPAGWRPGAPRRPMPSPMNRARSRADAAARLAPSASSAAASSAGCRRWRRPGSATACMS